MAFQVIGAGEEGVAFGNAVEAKGAQGSNLKKVGCKEFTGTFRAEGQIHEDQAGSNDGTTGETTAGGKVTIQNDVDTKQNNGGHQDQRGIFKNGIFGQIEEVLGLQLMGELVIPGFVFVDAQHDEHTDAGGKQHVGFTQGIEGTVVKDHTGHIVDGTGFADTAVDVAAGYLVGVGGAERAELGQIGNGPEQHTDQNGAGDYCKHPIDLFKGTDLQELYALGGILQVGVVFVAGLDVLRRYGAVAVLKMLGKVKVAVPPLFKFLDHG